MLGCISDYSYIPPLESAMNIDKTIKTPRKSSFTFVTVDFPVRARFLQLSTKVMLKPARLLL